MSLMMKMQSLLKLRMKTSRFDLQGGKKLSKKRINIYLTQNTIEKADQLARELAYKTGKSLNRSNILEIALWYLSKDVDQLDQKQLKSILEEEKEN